MGDVNTESSSTFSRCCEASLPRREDTGDIPLADLPVAIAAFSKHQPPYEIFGRFAEFDPRRRKLFRWLRLWPETLTQRRRRTRLLRRDDAETTTALAVPGTSSEQ